MIADARRRVTIVFTIQTFAPSQNSKRVVLHRSTLGLRRMSTASLDVSDKVPVQRADLDRILNKELPGVIFPEQDKVDYLRLLQALHTTIEQVEALPGGCIFLSLGFGLHLIQITHHKRKLIDILAARSASLCRKRTRTTVGLFAVSLRIADPTTGR